MQRVGQLQRRHVPAEHLYLSLGVGAALRGGQKSFRGCPAETVALVLDHDVQVASRHLERSVHADGAAHHELIIKVANFPLGPQGPQPHRPAQEGRRAEGVVHRSSPCAQIPALDVGARAAHQGERFPVADTRGPRHDLELRERTPVVPQSGRVHPDPVLAEGIGGVEGGEGIGRCQDQRRPPRDRLPPDDQIGVGAEVDSRVQAVDPVPPHGALAGLDLAAQGEPVAPGRCPGRREELGARCPGLT